MDNKSTAEPPTNRNLFEPLAAKAENSKMNNTDVDDNLSQDISVTSVTDNTTDNLQAQDKELDTSETAAETMGNKASSSFLDKDDSSNPNIIDPLNTSEYQDNFLPLQLSAEAKAIADAAKAKNALRREHLLKIAEENSRRTIAEQVEQTSTKEADTSTSDNTMEIDADEDKASGVEINGITLQQLEESSAATSTTNVMQMTTIESDKQSNNDSIPQTKKPKNPYTKGILRQSPSSASTSIKMAQLAKDSNKPPSNKWFSMCTRSQIRY